MGKSSDQLREEIDAQRADAGAKIDELQNQVQQQVDDTRQQVTDTASQVRGEAQAMVDDTVDTVKHAVQDFDFERQIQERPLLSVGVAMIGGFVLGGLLSGTSESRHHQGGYSSGYASSSGMGSHDGGQSTAESIGSSLRTAAQKSGLEETISNAGAALMGSVTEQLKQKMDQNFPGFSEKLDTAQQRQGSFEDKAAKAQRDAQQE